MRAISRATGPLLTAALILSACGPAENPPRNAAEDKEASKFVNGMVGAEPPAPRAEPFAVSDKTDLLEFAYAYPAPAAAVPSLVDKFQKELTSGKADALKMAQDDSKAAKASGFPFHAHSLETRWSVTADTPRFLALESSTYVFTGGAHGMTGYDAILWDKARKRETDIKAVMTTPAAFAAAIHDPFCKELDRQRAEKRGAPVVRGDDEFTQCIDPMKEVLAPVSKDGKLIDGITVVIGPFSAGPYAEGNYNVTLPVDAAMRNAIKTEYQDAFVKP